MNYESFRTVESHSRPGVSFKIRRMSFERRVELTRKIRELAQKVEYLDAGDDVREKIESALLTAQVEQLYLLWGLTEVSGLELDGRPATPELLAATGPEDLCREVVAEVKAECGLNDDERKN